MKGISRLLASIARATASKPRAVLAAALFVTILAAFSASRLDLRMNIHSLIPEDFPAYKSYREGMRGFEQSRFIFVILKSPEGEPVWKYRPFFLEYKRRLGEMPDIKRGKLDVSREQLKQTGEYLQKHAVALASPADLEGLSARLSPEAIQKALKLSGGEKALAAPGAVYDPLDLLSYFEGLLLPSKAIWPDSSGDFFVTQDDRMAFFMITTKQPIGTIEGFGKIVEEARQNEEGAWEGFTSRGNAEIRALARPTVSWVGPNMVLLKDNRALRLTILISIAASALLIGILFSFFFRSRRALLLTYGTLGVGIVASFGVAKLTVDMLNIMTVGIGGILLGLGIDFPVYLLNDFYQRRANGEPFLEALTATWGTTGRSVFYGALTMIASFSLVAFSRFRAFAELGIVMGLGLLLMLAAVLFIMPALLALLESKREGRPIVQYPQALVRFPLRRAGLTVIVCAILAVGFGWTARHNAFESPIETYTKAAHAKGNASREEMERFSQRLGIVPVPVSFVVQSDDWEEALQINDRLAQLLARYRAQGRIGFIDTLSNWLPSERRQQEALSLAAKLPNLDPAKFFANFTAALLQNRPLLAPSALTDLMQIVPQKYRDAIAKTLAAREPVGREDLASEQMNWVFEHYLAPDDAKVRLATYVYLPTDGDPAKAKATLMAELAKDDLFTQGLASSPSEEEIVVALERIVKQDAACLGGIIFAAILVILWIHFGSLGLALVSVTPMLVGAAMTLGGFALLGGELRATSLLWFPIYIGLAIDDVIILGGRLRRADETLQGVLSRCGAAVALTSLTVMIGIGTLGLSSFPILKQVGLLVSIAVGCELLASLLLYPALIGLLRLRKTFIR